MRKKNVAAWVEPELARAMERLAEAGNRTLSREAAEALRRHVLLSEIPAAAPRDPELRGQSSLRPHAGSEREENP
jgi:hypothetical protein